MAEESLECSYCGASRHEVDQLVAGRSTYICNRCVARAFSGMTAAAGAGEPDSAARGSGETPACCSFCARTAAKVRLVGNDRAHICDRCLLKAMRFMVDSIALRPEPRRFQAR